MRNEVEARTVFLFKERFMKSVEDIDSVLDMYCQIDDLEQFAKSVQQIKMSEQRVQELLLVSFKHDSFKVAFHLS